MVLSKQDYLDYIEGHHRLLHFVGVKHGWIDSGHSLEKNKSIPFETKLKCRESFNSDLKVLDEYVSVSGSKLDKINTDIINGFKRKISGDFAVLKSLKKHTIFIGAKGIYGVTALYDPFSQKIDEFPAYVKATLLPYRGKIIYDGFLEIYSVRFGKNIRENMNEEYQAAKKSGKIITYIEGI
jgi:hypothetical protein